MGKLRYNTSMKEKQQPYWADSLRDRIDEKDELPVEMRDALITAVTIVDFPGRVVHSIQNKIKERFLPKDPLSK